MKTNIGIVTTDESRVKIAQNLGLKEKMVSRKALTEAVMAYVQELIDGTKTEKPAAVPASICDPADHSTNHHQASSASTDGFTPSRGDEPYLLKARDPVLREKLSALLDCVEDLESYTWSKHEENRE